MLDPLFLPETIALLGASRNPAKVGRLILANLVSSGFKGVIVPVNPNAQEKIQGLDCAKSLATCGRKIDLAIIVLPRDKVRQGVIDAIDAGAKAIVVVSSGFRDAGNEGGELEQSIVGICRMRGARLLGPNCLGLINTANRMNAFFGMHMPKQGGISMISQSSALCSAFLDRIDSCELGVAKVINLGNKGDITEIDLLRALAKDEQTKVIVGYLESISSGDDFVKAAEEASICKPVIILKAANTRAGRQAVAAHSGFIMGADTAYGAAFKRSGVIRADTFGALFDYAAAFSMQPLPKGNRVLVITNAGGPGIMAVDSIEKAGLQAAHLSEEHQQGLLDELPPNATIFNPIDLTGDAGPQDYEKTLKRAYADPGVDALLVIFVGRVTNRPMEIAEMLVQEKSAEKPVFISFVGGESVCQARSMLRPAGLPEYDCPEHGVAALKAMWDYVAWSRRPPRVVTRFRVHRRRVERIISRTLRAGKPQIGEVKAKDILGAYDFNIPEGCLAANPEEAMEVAGRLGYPVALKIVSPDIIHKTDFGGVRLNIANREELRDGFDLMMLRMAQRAPAATLDGVYVEKMVEPGLEVILGMNRDPQFGPMLMFGLGGIVVEVMKDVAFHLAPITFDEAIVMLTSTRSYEILTSARGEKAVDLDAIARCLQRVSQLATDFPQIQELDINPLIVGDMGVDPYVADARMVLGKRLQGC